jgi:hypothetical protein
MGFVASITTLPARFAAPAARARQRRSAMTAHDHLAEGGCIAERRPCTAILRCPVGELRTVARADRRVVAVPGERRERLRDVAGTENPIS